VKKHGVIFFDAGRGFGLTGMTVVIVRKDLIGFQLDTCPDMMCFEKSITTKSIINTPYTLVPLLFAEYVTYCQKENKSLENVSAHLKTIKQNYVHAIAKKTTVVETSSNGIVIFKVP
jgi:phosphoserine aminotransferase